MKAVRIHSHGDVDVLCIDNISEPKCLNNTVKVQVKASALNHLDIWVRGGLPGINIPLPLIMGSDGSGKVVEIGENIKNFNVGDDIVIQPGTFDQNCKFVKNKMENYSPTYGILGETENGIQAEYVILKENNLHKMSNSLTYEEAASMQLVFMTAYQMLITRANLFPEDFILIYGATSGIGSASIQIAKDIGAKVITTVGSENKFQYAYDMGADYVLNHKQSLVDKIKSITKYKGVNIVCEHIGKDTWEQSLKVLSKGGKIVTCGSTTGSIISIDLRHLFMKQQSILGSTMSNIESFKKVMEKIESKKYKPFIDKVYNFNQIKNAHKRIESRNHSGKVVLIP